MENLDYLKLAEQYGNFLVAAGSVSITVLALVLNLGFKSGTASSTRIQRDSRTFLIAALLVSTISCFIGTHMMAETAAFVTYSKASGATGAHLGARHFLLASTNIFVAALLILFALMLLPTASGEKNAARITPISITAFLCLIAAIIYWLVLAAIYRVDAPNPLLSIGIPFGIAFVWFFIHYRFFPRQLMLSASFVPIIVFTGFLLIFFALTFNKSEEVLYGDIFIFCLIILFSCASLLAAGIKIMWGSLGKAQKAFCAKVAISAKLMHRHHKKSTNPRKKNVQIQQMTLADKPALLAFLREAYAESPRMSDDRFWSWHFLENPYVKQDNLPVWLAKSGDRIAGQLAAIPVNLCVEGKRVRAMWILDLIVHEDFRRQGIAKRLVLESEKYCAVGLGVNTMEQHAPALLQSVGWTIVRKIPRYSKILYPGNVFPEIARTNFLRKTFNLLSIFFRPTPDEDLFADDGSLREVEKFDAAFDDFWREAAQNRTCAVARDSVLLEWLYLKQPGKKFDVIGYFEGEKLLGYAVLFIRKAEATGAVTKAAITDLCYGASDSEKVVDALIKGALQKASNCGAGVLVTDAVDNLLEARLRHFRFCAVKNPLQLMVKSNQYQDLLLDAEKWFLTRGDSDISIFEKPNL